MNLGFLGGIAVRAMADKKLRDAETALTVVAGQKPQVIIAWQGAPLDGHSGVLEGTNEQGKSLIRLDATGGVFAVPGQFVVAAPAKEKKTDEEKGADARKPAPGSRGSAPQENEMGKKAKENVTEIVEAPTKLERTKPQALPIEEARTAPEAGAAIETVVEKILSIENEKKAAVAKLTKFKEGLNLELIDQSYLKTVKQLHDLVEEKGEPVLKLKDKFLATSVKRDVSQANMSAETQKKFDDFLAKLDAKKAEMAKINEAVEELVNASFARMGGTEKQEQHVTMFEDKNKKKMPGASLIAFLSAQPPKDASQGVRFNRLQAGLKEMFNAVVEMAKDFVKGIGDLVSSGDAFLSAYEKDAKAAEKAEPVVASKVLAGLDKFKVTTKMESGKTIVWEGEAEDKNDAEGRAAEKVWSEVGEPGRHDQMYEQVTEKVLAGVKAKA